MHHFTFILLTVAGSCCNLRNHTCDIHNRGLNNKCYDNCMCEEGEQEFYLYIKMFNLKKNVKGGYTYYFSSFENVHDVFTGLRCFAKLHRNDHIKGKKGQCVDPEGVNLNHGMFIVV